MIINEIFYSLQGEGLLASLPSVFIRLAGCPLRCRWCDTKYAWDESAGVEYSAEHVKAVLRDYPAKNVVITGGEPMVKPGLADFLAAGVEDDMHITIETAGINFVPDLRCDLMSISPKLSNSAPSESGLRARHERLRYNPSAIQALIDNYDYQLKFVVESIDDLDEIAACLAGLRNVKKEKVLLMPQARHRDELIKKSVALAEYCMKKGFRLGQRLHILLWNGQKGK